MNSPTSSVDQMGLHDQEGHSQIHNMNQLKPVSHSYSHPAYSLLPSQEYINPLPSLSLPSHPSHPISHNTTNIWSPPSTNTQIADLKKQLEELKSKLANLQGKYEQLQASIQKENQEREIEDQSVKVKMDGVGKGVEWSGRINRMSLRGRCD